jgi:hypothetical protein
MIDVRHLTTVVNPPAPGTRRGASGPGVTTPSAETTAPSLRFVFMLTRNDTTVANAGQLVDVARAAGVRHIGAKDVGLPRAELEALFSQFRDAGMATYLEVVSERPEDALRSAEVALVLRPDFLIGGIDIAAIQSIIAGSGIQFFPYVGRVVGHPCLLRGTVNEIVDDACRAADAGIDGINLLAYRYDGDVEDLVSRVVSAVPLPVLCAGSVDSPARITALRRLRAWGFTVGTAVLDRQLLPQQPVELQLRAVMQIAGGNA